MQDKRILLENNPAIQAINSNKIYVYTVTDLNGNQVNEGWVKVGQTIRLTDSRIHEQTHTAGLRHEILYEVSALDINANIFTDKEIHDVLVKKGLKKEEGYEWFTHKGYTQQQLVDFIKKVVSNRINCTEDYEQLKNNPTLFKLRPNQDEAVQKTFARWEIANQNKDDFTGSKKLRQFLWNAKPRFGKTLTAYEFAKKIGAKKILIVTQRTSISDSWHRDYYDYIKDSTDFKFGSSKENKYKINGRVVHTALNKSESQKLAQSPNQSLIFYISFADIKAKTQREFKENNKWIFDTEWDLFIVDETHEASETDKAIAVFEKLKTNFTLHLSGTPFKKIYGKDYDAKNTYTWSYTDEQEQKHNWDFTKGKNPYAEMPRLSVFTYQLSKELRKVCMSEEYSFDFSEFFKISGDKFIHESEIIQFLDNLSAEKSSDVMDASSQYYPFADPKTRNELRHTFWLLPQYNGVKMCELLKKLIKAHPFFKDYEVINASGTGDNDRAKSDKALNEVESKIGDKPWETKTITLSCGQLTTGITVPSWTAVLMLNNLQSPAPYLQAAFRAQNPWSYEINGNIYNKTECFVFDFAPDRILKIIDDYANLDVYRRENHERKQNIKKLINYLSVLSLDRTGKMSYLDASDILEMPHYFDAKDIVDNGFMSNKLFNIGGIFSLPKAKREEAEAILNQMTAVKNKKIKKNEPDVDTSNVDIAENIRISESPLGEKQYEIIVTDESGNETVEIIQDKDVKSILETIEDDDEFENTELKDALQEISKEKSNIQSEEDKQRDRLRGFSRTIPMFLMAYANNSTTLANFDEYINAQVFEELAGITKEQFRVLRDECQFFNDSRFNSAIKEFLDRKNALKYYYKENVDEDIFDYIPPQDTNQIFTPKKVVNMQLDMLEQANPMIFKNPHNTFFDPQMKSGQYITEIAKRLYKYSKDKDIKRILTTQLYGLAPTKILTDITHEYIFGFAELRDKRHYKNNFVEYNLLSKEVNGDEIIKKPGGLKNVIEELWGSDMKFTAVVGNPPYQEETKHTSDNPVYHYFIDSAQSIADINCLIHPARFLFNAGKTPKIWNKKMLSDKHLKVIKYLQKSTEVFQNTDIKGGIAITLRDANKDFGSIGTFTHFEELDSILNKISVDLLKGSLSDIYISTDSYNFTKKMHADHTYAKSRLSKGHEKTLASSVFTTLPEIFTEKKMSDEDLKFIGLSQPGNRRTWRFINKSYIENNHPNLNKWKVILPGSNGSGALGEVLSTPLIGEPLIGEPLIGHTQTFISFGAFDQKNQADNLLKYIRTKFARTMLGTLKITQSNKKETWRKVPLQDFTVKSDIDWSKSIPEIDKQLYKKYNLTKEEIDFIETRIKAMA